jgi:hypothetical protein
VRPANAACAPWLLAAEDRGTTAQWCGVLRDAARLAAERVPRTPAVGGSAVELHPSPEAEVDDCADDLVTLALSSGAPTASRTAAAPARERSRSRPVSTACVVM